MRNSIDIMREREKNNSIAGVVEVPPPNTQAKLDIPTEISPLIPTSKNEPMMREITPKSVCLVVLLSVVLGGANAYLGLFAGITVSVSIPSAIFAMVLLRPFNANILEINAVQTGASAGSSLAAGIIYTLPALIMSEYWQEIHYLETTLIAIIGGVLGIMFAVPLRRVLIVDNPLKYPEGVATAEVIKVAHVAKNRKSKLALILFGALVGIVSKLAQSGFMFWSPSFQASWYVFGIVIYIGCTLSPALIAVGYIIKLRIAFLLLLGGILNWWVAIPLVSYFDTSVQTEGLSPTTIANNIWTSQTRYIGVGAMLLGGVGVVVSLGRPLWRGLKSAYEAYKVIKKHGMNAISRTERDIPIPFVVITIAVFTIPMAFIYCIATDRIGIGIAMTFLMLFCGFLFSAVAAYMAGIVGSSNNPISGVTLATMIVASGMLLLFLGARNEAGPPTAILIGAVVCCSAAVCGDNLQDIKAGAIVGSTPMVLQVMQLIGVAAPSLILSPTVGLLINAYGLGNPDATHPNPLPAPQASLMRAVTESIFFGDIPYLQVGVGMGLAAIVMFVDFVAAQAKLAALRVPVLSIALGLYLPFQLTVPIFLGGLTAWIGSKTLQRLQSSDRVRKLNESNGVLYAAGLITGEALVGIAIAIPIVITHNSNVMAFLGVFTVQWPGILVIIFVMVSLFFVVIRHRLLELQTLQNASIQTK